MIIRFPRACRLRGAMWWPCRLAPERLLVGMGGCFGEMSTMPKLRDIIGPKDAPPLNETLIDFVDWVADYTLYPAGAVLRMVISVPAALEPPKQVTLYKVANEILIFE